MSQPLLIIGASGNASDLLDTIDAVNIFKPTWLVVGVLDDRRLVGDRYMSLEVLGGIRDAARFDECALMNAIGSPVSYRLRPRIVESTGVSADRFATILHPHSSISRSAHIGRGVMAGFGVSVGGGARIGDHVVLGTGCIIGHDAVIADHTIIAPGAVVCGYCRIGRNVYIGAGAVVRTYVCVCDDALVGMGAVVIRDIEPNSVVVGNPARLLRRSELVGSVPGD